MLLRSLLKSRHVHFCVAAILALTTPGAAAYAWERAHSVGSNTGYADVVTTPAKKAPITVPNLGTFAPGAGPVIAPDGTVYLGNKQGKLIALHADGSHFWSRDITSGHAITASPLVAPNGSVYVIGTMEYTDHRVNPAVHAVKSVLNIFNSTGGWLGQVPFPDHGGPGAAYAPLNLWRSGGNDVLMVTATYRNRVTGGYDVRLIAFSTSGQVLADQKVTTVVQTVSGSAECPFEPFCFGGFEHGVVGLQRIPPGIGLFTYAGGGTPFIVVSDNIKDLVGYTFDGSAFIERWRVHSNDYFMRSTPTILPDGHTIIGIEKIVRRDGQERESGTGAVMFAGPNMSSLPRIDGTGRVYAAPTVTRDGRAALVGGDGDLTIVQGGQIAAKIEISGGSIASAAASRTHLFVSTPDAFLSYDVNTLAEVARINWVGGGSSPPAIGPKGHVYAIASNILFVFPPAARAPLGGGNIVPPRDLVAVDRGQPSDQPASHLYHPPLTTHGNRLFACLELDQDDCGKGDYREIAKAFCEAQGFAEADDLDVDSRKVKAETLDGRFCSRNKCKVFDHIDCAM